MFPFSFVYERSRKDPACESLQITIYSEPQRTESAQLIQLILVRTKTCVSTKGVMASKKLTQSYHRSRSPTNFYQVKEIKTCSQKLVQDMIYNNECPPTGSRSNKMWFLHTLEYYLAVKKSEVLTHE